MSSFKIDIKGLPNVQKQLINVSKDVSGRVQTAMNTYGENVVRDAKLNVTQQHPEGATDRGGLSNSISFIPAKINSKEIELEIVVNKKYAAYIEFGTRKFAARYVSTLPADWQTFAATFKGPGGGSLADLIKNIMEWVVRKGFAAERTKSGNKSKSKSSVKAQEQAAYASVLQILLNGSKPHPFLKPAIDKNRPQLISDLDDAIKL